MTSAGLLALAAVVLLAPATGRPVRRFRPYLTAIAAAVGVAGLALALTGAPPVALVAGGAAAALPRASRSRRHQRRVLARRRAWPEALELVRSHVRAGAPVAAAVARAAPEVPGALADSFADTAAELAAGHSFERAACRLAPPEDPVGRRVVLILVIADQVGATDTGRVLGESVAFLRADLAQWREVQARHSWNVAAARIALAAPWLTVLALSLHPAARAAYAEPAGVTLLTVVAVLTALAYATMTRIAAAGNRA